MSLIIFINDEGSMILVTGCVGFIGPYTVLELAHARKELLELDNLRNSSELPKKKGSK